MLFRLVINGGDYVLQLKANQKSFYDDVYAMFDEKYMDETDRNCEYEIYKTEEKSHGRIERRTCYVLNEIAFFTDYLANWKGLKKIFAVVREVEKDNKVTKETSCYLSSKNTTAENLLSYTRKHWEIRDRKMPLSQKNYRDYNFSTRKIEYFAATSKNCR